MIKRLRLRVKLWRLMRRDAALCGTFKHQWVQEYYGVRCSVCGLFYPDGCAPWEDTTI
jgi:hypothetical protein